MEPQQEALQKRISEIKNTISAGQTKKALDASEVLLKNEDNTLWSDVVVLLKSRLTALEDDDMLGIEPHKSAKVTKINQDHLNLLDLYSTYISNPNQQKEIEQRLKRLLTRLEEKPVSLFNVSMLDMITPVVLVLLGALFWFTQPPVELPSPDQPPGRNKNENIIMDQRALLRQAHEDFESIFEGNRPRATVSTVLENTKEILGELKDIPFKSVDDSHNLWKAEALAKVYFMLSMLEEKEEKKEDYALKIYEHCDTALQLIATVSSRQPVNEDLEDLIDQQRLPDIFNSHKLTAMAILCKSYQISDAEMKQVFNEINGNFFEDEGFGCYQPVKQLVKRKVIDIDTTIIF